MKHDDCSVETSVVLPLQGLVCPATGVFEDLFKSFSGQREVMRTVHCLHAFYVFAWWIRYWDRVRNGPHMLWTFWRLEVVFNW